MLLPRLSLSSQLRKNWIYIGTAVFLIVIIAAVAVFYAVSLKAKEARLAAQQKSFEAPLVAVKRQVKKVTLRRVRENGTNEFIEILANGRINQYDENYNLEKSGLLGYYELNRLLESINLNIDDIDLSSFGSGSYTLVIETNQGVITIEVTQGGGGNGLLEEILQEINNLKEETLYPTPTPPQPTTAFGTSPSSTPVPGPSQAIQIQPTPTVGPGTPTPLPNYMTAEPFECEDIQINGKPLPISNILCGFNANELR